jgi:hypothetical protein
MVDDGKALKAHNFVEFWSYYVRAHLVARNRWMHFVGTFLGFICLAIAAVQENPWWILIGLVIGYSMAWLGHFLFEKKGPATFRYPLWSLMANFRMFYLILNGKMSHEVRTHQTTPES